jgi:hypothetical protein
MAGMQMAPGGAAVDGAAGAAGMGGGAGAGGMGGMQRMMAMMPAGGRVAAAAP